MKTVDRIVEKFREFGCELPAKDYQIRRIRAGEWAWCLRSKTDLRAHCHGSTDFVRDIKKNWQRLAFIQSHGDCEIYISTKLSAVTP